jgi:hypothetical protein
MVLEAGGFLNTFNPATRQVEGLKQKLSGKIDVRPISRGGKDPHLERVLTQTILGERTASYQTEVGELTKYELSILHREPPPRVRVILDFDGVLISPIHLERRVGEAKMLLLARIIKAADEVVIFTNRQMPQEGRFASSGNFPFFGRGVMERMRRVFGEKLEFEKKDWGKDPTKLSEIALRPIGDQPVDMTYLIGSARNDRVKISEMGIIKDPQKVVILIPGIWSFRVYSKVNLEKSYLINLFFFLGIRKINIDLTECVPFVFIF